MAIDRFDAFRGFEAGQKIGGASSLGSFVKNLTAMAQQVGLSKLKGQQELETGIALAKAKGPIEAETERLKTRAIFEEAGKFAGGASSPDGTQTGGGFRVTKINAGPFTLEDPEAQAREAARAQSLKDSETRLGKVREVVPSFQILEQRASELPTLSPGLGLPLGAAGIFASSKLQLDPRLKNYQDQKDAIRPELARLVDVGNLTQSEQVQAERKIPGEYEVPETKANKVSDFYSFIIARSAANARNKGIQITEDDFAKEFGVIWIPSQRRVTSPAILDIQDGRVVNYDNYEERLEELRERLRQRGVIQ